jgi:hypothetical protein
VNLVRPISPELRFAKSNEHYLLPLLAPRPVFERFVLSGPIGVEERDIGEWSDDHPLNYANKAEKFAKGLFYN